MTYGPLHRVPAGQRGSRLRTPVVIIAMLVILAVGASAAMAFWVSTDSSNPARAAADALGTGSAPTGTVTSQNVTLNWAGGSTVGGRPANGYTVTRYASASGGTPVAATGGCTGTVTVLTCTENAVPLGVWYYTVTPHLSLWVGTESGRTAFSVNQAPAFASAAAVTLTVGVAGTFTVSTTGFPTATVAESGTLPAGVAFTPNGNGTGTLAGTPSAGTGGIYPLTLTASNGVGSNASQAFTLAVAQSPAITSAPGVTFTVGVAGTFTVSTTGFPVPPTITSSGTLPSGVTFANNGNGTATIAGGAAVGTQGAYGVTLTASNGVAPAATQHFTLTVLQATATKLVLTASTTTPTAGAADNVTITAVDASNNVVIAYSGTKNLVFGGASSIGGFSPSVINSAGVTTTFGTTTTVTFTNGVATVSGGKNGVLLLYKAETATITVTDGSISNGTGLTVTVKVAGITGLALANVNHSVTCGSISSNYSCTAAGLGSNGSLTANLSFVDGYGNLVVQSPTSDDTISLTTPTKGEVAPASVVIPAGTTTSNGTFTLTKQGSNAATTTATFGTTFSLVITAN